MKTYKKEFIAFLKDYKYIVPVILIVILGYGYVLTHLPVSIDSLSCNRYFEGTEFLGQGRFGAPIMNKIFNVLNFNPFFVDFLAVIFLILAVTMFCTLFKIITKNKLHFISYTVFSCIFLSYALINEIFVYSPAGLNIAINYLLVATSLILLVEFIKSKKYLYLVFICTMLIYGISVYESIVPVYLCGIFIVCILSVIYNKINNKEILKVFAISIIILIISIILETIISKLIISVFSIQISNNAADYILYKTNEFISGIKYLIKTIWVNYIVASLHNISCAVYCLSVLISCVFGVKYAKQYKRVIIIILFLGLMLSTISLSILQGFSSVYRTCQVFQLFVGFIFLLFTNEILNSNLKKIVKNVIMFFIFLIVFYQVKELHNGFYLNYLRYEQERIILINIGNEIQRNCDYTKPIIFVGEIGFSKYISDNEFLDLSSIRGKLAIKLRDLANIETTQLRYHQTTINSCINWGIIAFYEYNEYSLEIIKWMNMLGYNFKAAKTQEIYNEASLFMENKPDWPKEGSIVERDNYIIVNL